MSNGQDVRVALVDDHEMIRQALASFLSESPGIEVVAQAASRPEAIQMLLETKPDLLILDYTIPGGGALPVIEAITSHQLDTRVLVLTVHNTVHYAIMVLEAGAHGFMVKSSAIKELIEAIHTVQNGGIYITPSMMQ